MASQCLVCESTHATTPFNNGKFAVRECAVCKYGVVDPIPSEKELADLYNSEVYFATHMDYDYQTISDATISKLVANSYQLHNGHLAKYLRPSQRLLEIGPGGGFALKAFQQAGLQVMGVETSTSSCHFAQERLGIPMVNSALEAFEAPHRFDVVMLNHVLEHFTDLQMVMRKLNSLLVPGGLLYIRVPDHDSYDRRTYGDQWPAYLPFHISYFSARSLSIILQKYGFAVLEVKKYISEKVMSDMPTVIRSLVKKGIVTAGLTDKYSGRTITVIGRKTSDL